MTKAQRIIEVFEKEYLEHEECGYDLFCITHSLGLEEAIQEILDE